MHYREKNRIQHLIQPHYEILSEETPDEKTVFNQYSLLPSVAAEGIFVAIDVSY